MFRNRIIIAITTVLVVFGIGILMQITFDNSDEQAPTTAELTTTTTEQVTATTERALIVTFDEIADMPVVQRLAVDQPFDGIVDLGECNFLVQVTSENGGTILTGNSSCLLGSFIAGDDAVTEMIPIVPNNGFGANGAIADRLVIVACADYDASTCQKVVFV